MLRINDLQTFSAQISPDLRECSDQYIDVLFAYGDYRVIACKNGIQWILQRRRAGTPYAGRAWDALSYTTERASLERLWQMKTGNSYSALAALPLKFDPKFQSKIRES